MDKFYAVVRGKKQGIYRNWPEAKEQIEKFKVPIYKSFLSFEDALSWSLEALKMDKYPNSNNEIQYTNGPTGRAQRAADLKALKAPKDIIKIYTDGGSRNTGSKKGEHLNAYDKSSWAYQIVFPSGKVIANSGAELGKTNNMMELKAFAKACEAVVNLGLSSLPLMFILDSRYVLNPLETKEINKWASNNWLKERANKEYWKSIWENYHLITGDLYFKWVKGHAATEGNNRVDQMVNDAMDSMM